MDGEVSARGNSALLRVTFVIDPIESLKTVNDDYRAHDNGRLGRSR